MSSDESEPGDNASYELNGSQSLIIDTNLERPVELPKAVQVQGNMQQQSSSAQPTTLPSDSFRLLESYSTYTQCWLPICEKIDVLKLSYSYPPQGLLLSPDLTDSGHHAEMWSIFALGSCQDLAFNPEGSDSMDNLQPGRLYKIAQSLIPNELGKFQLGHVKALINLALFNLRTSRNDAAWLLVGAASRILPTICEHQGPIETRRAHVVACCYLLDNLLAISLNRRPYLSRGDLRASGKIEEDGLEEWYVRT